MGRTKTCVLAAAAGVLSLAGCRREDRDYRPSPPFGGPVASEREYEGNAYALSEGKRLFAAFNCRDCHAAGGGGGIGPPLRDKTWVYGYEPRDVYESISRGRPNGMPAFGGGPRDRPDGVNVAGDLPEYQIWQLTAYVRSLSGLTSGAAAPGRDDHMQTGPPENERKPEAPVVAPPPDAGDMPR